MNVRFSIAAGLAAWLACSASVLAQTAVVSGTVRDQSGAVLPGVSVEIRGRSAAPRETFTDERGEFRFHAEPPGRVRVRFRMLNFSSVRRDLIVPASGTVAVDAALQVALYADVIVTGKTTFTNLADAVNPAQDLVGIAQSASQGAITARQLDVRPLLRTGEVLETIPGLIVSQHSGEGKANQYYLRGFNLDHGTDFATTVAGMPVNMPTHGHGHGYSDLNFLIPELVSGIQYSKGPYFAEQGDFATAGSSNINYVSSLASPIVRLGGGSDAYGRALAAGSMAAGGGALLGAFEVEHADGPWNLEDDYRKVNGLVRYTRGSAQSGFSLTGMAYRGQWNSSDQIPQRAVDEGLIGRFGARDTTDGGDTYRYSGSFEWQHSGRNAATKLTAYGIGYDLNLFSNFTFFLDDPEHGDQFHQADHRFVSGAKVSHRRLGRWAGRSVQNTFGAQVRNDRITNVGLYHTQARDLLDVVRQDSVLQTSGAVYAQNEIEWGPRFRTMVGVRGDEYRFRVDAGDPANSGTVHAGLVSPKGGAVIGPWGGTELYVNAGVGFHSNDARGATITRDPSSGDPVERVTPLVRATAAEFGVRTVSVPHLQSSLAVWTLSLDSELVFVGDAGTVEASRPSHRYGLEWANYFTPRPWLIIDGDFAFSHGHFNDGAVNTHIPGSADRVVSAGVTVDGLRNVFGSVRWRYFGPRPLVEDNSVRSKATSLVNAEAGYKLTKSTRLAVDVYNIFNAAHSDVDYFYASRLPGEPAGGVDDIHFHPALPRTARVSLIVGF